MSLTDLFALHEDVAYIRQRGFSIYENRSLGTFHVIGKDLPPSDVRAFAKRLKERQAILRRAAQ